MMEIGIPGKVEYGSYPGIDNATIVYCPVCRHTLIVYRTGTTPSIFRDISCCGEVRVLANAPIAGMNAPGSEAQQEPPAQPAQPAPQAQPVPEVK